MSTRPVDSMNGLSLEGGWHVTRPFKRSITATGGKFSAGYIVENESGRQAYLKALDFALALQSDDPPAELLTLTQHYVFERDLLMKCRDRNLRRVVTPIDHGTVLVPGGFGAIAKVYYLIFDLAHGDIRTLMEGAQQFETAWSLRSLHHTAVGLKQLHSAGIAHQDLKPSNVLIFEHNESKIADLGRASSQHHDSPYDELQIPGDVGYAPPEQRYRNGASRGFRDRCLADLYLLGSLIHFHFTAKSMNAAMISQAHDARELQSYSETFEQDLPYLQQRFSEVLFALSESLHNTRPDVAKIVVELVKKLCEPDPDRRGEVGIANQSRASYNLVRVISQLDLAATRSEMELR